MLKVSDEDYAYKLLMSFTNDDKDFGNLYWNNNIDTAMGMYGLRLRAKQMNDGFYRLTVIDPKKWMLTVLKFEFEVK